VRPDSLYCTFINTYTLNILAILATFRCTDRFGTTGQSAAAAAGSLDVYRAANSKRIRAVGV
jgi:hypothetical protein